MAANCQLVGAKIKQKIQMPKFFILFFEFCLAGWIFIPIFARNFSADNIVTLLVER